LIWNPEDPLWYGAFAVPLFAIENDSDVKRELVAPVREILMLYKKSEKEFSKKSAEEIEQTAFAQTRDVLRWRKTEKGLVVLENA
jgi:hypothetical protein